jgi:flagellar hook-associated protein 2
MAGMAVDGLISGMNTTEMISQLMQLEAAPQTLLKGKVTTTESLVSALQSLNTKVSSLGEAAAKAATPASWGAVTATSSAPSVTATVTAGTPASTITFHVGSLAAKQTSVSDPVTDLAGVLGAPDVAPTRLTLARGVGDTMTVKEIDLEGVKDLAGLAKAINGADAGVTASLVKVSPTESRLQLSSTASGEENAFDLYAGAVPAAAIKDRTAAAPLLARDAAVTAAADASVVLWKGTASEQTVESPTNAFTGVFPGMTFTISAEEEKPVTLTIARQDSTLKKLGSDLVGNLNTVLSDIASRTKSTTSKGKDGQEVVKGGILSADSSIRSIQQTVLSAASQPVDGISPSSMGLVLGRDGTFTFDETKFAAALAADPARVQAVVSGVAERVQKAAKSVSDPVSGTLTTKIQGQQSYVKSLNLQVESWDNRLALRRTTLERTYAALEVSMSKLNSQSDWLTSQIQQMNANNQ